VTVRWIPTLVVALLLSACAGAPTPAPWIEASPEDTSSGVPGPDGHVGGRPAPAAPAPLERGRTELERPRVRLVDAGEEPRRELRYDFERSRVEVPVPGTLTATYGVGGTSTSDDALPERDPTTVAAPTEVTVVDVDEAGAATVAFGYGAGQVTDPGGLEDTELTTVERSLRTLQQVHSTYRIDDRGFLTLLDAEEPPEARRWVGTDVTSLARRVPAFVQPLPAEPVGVGAIWTISSSTDVGGVLVPQTITVELLERDGDHLELLFTVEEAGPADGGPGSGRSAAEADAALSSQTLDGGGNVTTRLDRPIPLGASKGLTATLVFEVDRGAARSSVERTIVSDASFEVAG
jgi:hypothetical protein